MFDGFDDEPWYIRWPLHARFVNPWPLIAVILLVVVLVVCLGS